MPLPGFGIVTPGFPERRELQYVEYMVPLCVREPEGRVAGLLEQLVVQPARADFTVALPGHLEDSLGIGFPGAEVVEV